CFHGTDCATGGREIGSDRRAGSAACGCWPDQRTAPARADTADRRKGAAEGAEPQARSPLPQGEQRKKDRESWQASLTIRAAGSAFCLWPRIKPARLSAADLGQPDEASGERGDGGEERALCDER